MHTKEQLLEQFNRLHEENIHVDTKIMQDFLEGKIQICVPAVNLVASVILKLYDRIEGALIDVSKSPHNEGINKNLLYHSLMLSKCFVMIYASALEDPEDIFFKVRFSLIIAN